MQHALYLLIHGLVIVLCCGVSTHAQESASKWKAAATKVVITPEKPMWMAGYASRTKPAEGTLTDLWAKALVLEEANDGLAVFITLDLIGISKTLADEICDPLMEEFGISRDRIAICSSHTHSGPALWNNLRPLHYLIVDQHAQDLIRNYTNSLAPRIVAAVKEARSRLAPVELSWASGTADFAVNRRNNPEREVPQRRTGKSIIGPASHDVPVLAVKDADGTLQAVVFGYACHSTVLDSYRWCGDYPGYAQIELENAHPGSIALFWAGCGGDQNPIPRRSVALAQHYGKRLAAAVDKVLLTTSMHAIESGLKTAFTNLELAYDKVPSPDQLKADASSENRYTSARALLLLEQLAQSGELPQSYPFPIGTWRLGNEVDFVFLGGEVVVDYAIRLPRELRGTRTWVVGYANDVMAYIPSERVLSEGGYEGGGAMVYYGLPANWAPGLEDRIVTKVVEMLQASSQQ